jgi:hypothetical protein
LSQDRRKPAPRADDKNGFSRPCMVNACFERSIRRNDGAGLFPDGRDTLRGPLPPLPRAPNRAAVCPRAVQTCVAAQQRVPETVVFIWKSYDFSLAFVLH